MKLTIYNNHLLAMSAMSDLIVSFHYPVYPSNTLPRKAGVAANVKLWQRLCACMAAFKTFDEQRQSNEQKFARMKSYYLTLTLTLTLWF